jgi:hypothetical protein
MPSSSPALPLTPLPSPSTLLVNPTTQAVLGDPTLEVELHPGDVLYLPRGTVHQAAAQQRDSAHLTISTYQRWSQGDLAATLLQVGWGVGGKGLGGGWWWSRLGTG